MEIARFGVDSMTYYAGIGSRKTPQPILSSMMLIGMRLANTHLILRSGGAVGADQYFEAGCTQQKGKKAIYTQNDGNAPSYLEHAKTYHPAWNKCSPIARVLHARNSLIMLGPYLNEPVKFVVCWTKDGEASGGTGQALRIAQHLNIPVFNLFHADALPLLENYVGMHLK